MRPSISFTALLQRYFNQIIKIYTIFLSASNKTAFNFVRYMVTFLLVNKRQFYHHLSIKKNTMRFFGDIGFKPMKANRLFI